MHLGVAMFFTDYSMSPQELAVAAEQRGFDSLWSPEHSHIPLSPKSAFPSGGDLPQKYYDAMDPFGARRALRYGDGWMPHRSRPKYPNVRELLPEFAKMAAEAKRDLATVPVTIWGAKEDEDMLKRDRDDGVVRVIISLESAKSDAILPELDRWAKLAQKVA